MLMVLKRVLLALIEFYTLLILVYVIMSWIPRGASKVVEDIRSVLAMVCEPYLGIFRGIIPPVGMMDFSPIVAFLVLQVLEMILAAIL